MNNLQAAVGLAQLEQLDKFIKKKRWIGENYNKLLAGVKGITLPIANTDYSKNIYWVYGILLDSKLKKSSEFIRNKLRSHGVDSRPFFYPLHKQPLLKKFKFYKKQSLPVSEKLYKKGFYIPSGLDINLKKIKRVSLIIKKVLNQYNK